MKPPKEAVTPDVLVANEGTVFLFNPLTARAKEWIDENVQPDAQWFGTTLVCEHRIRVGTGSGAGMKLIKAGKMPSLFEVVEAIRAVTKNPKHDPPVIHDVLVRTEGKKQSRRYDCRFLRPRQARFLARPPSGVSRWGMPDREAHALAQIINLMPKTPDKTVGQAVTHALIAAKEAADGHAGGMRNC